VARRAHGVVRIWRTGDSSNATKGFFTGFVVVKGPAEGVDVEGGVVGEVVEWTVAGGVAE
jgi:hypothetical protein